MEIFIQELRLFHSLIYYYCLVVSLRLKEALISHVDGERGSGVEGRNRDQMTL